MSDKFEVSDGVRVSSKPSDIMLTAFFWGLAAVVGLIHLNRYAFRSENKRLISEEETRCLIVVERDPTNAGAHAQLADLAYDRQDLELAIHEWRTAIRLLPEGPFTTSWKRKLKRALEMQAQQARGERPLEMHELRVCPKCEADLAKNARVCPRCGEVLYMNPVEFFKQPEVAREWARETAAFTVVLLCVGIIFMNVSIEWKGTLLMSTAIVGGYYFLKGIEG